MATIYKRPGSNKWWIRFSVGGREVQESARTSNREEAERILRRRMKELATHMEGAPGQRLSYKEAVARFFEHTRTLKPKTLTEYQGHARLWARFVGDMALADIDRSVLQYFVRARKSEGVSDTTIKRNLAFLSTLFTYMQSEWADAPETNPVLMFNKRKLREGRRIRWLTPDEFQRLKDACTQKVQRDILDVAVETGMRHSELKSLTWAERVPDLGIAGAYVFLDRREVHLIDTKNSKPRVVPLSEGAVEVLSRRPDHVRSPYVFWHSDGRPYEWFRNWFEGARKRAGLHSITFHSLRHTFATWWLQTGGDERRLQDILGHSSPQMVQRYAHLATEDLHKAMREMDDRKTRSSMEQVS